MKKLTINGKAIELKEPKAGELRGLKITNLIQLDVAEITTLIPRISALSAVEVENLRAADLAEIGGQIVNFFIKK